VDILGWHEEQDTRKKAEAVEDDIMKIVRFRMRKKMAKLKAEYLEKRANRKAREEKCQQYRTERKGVILCVIKKAELVRANPILPEHDDTLLHCNNYL
jgi:hypothetical protein